MNERIQKLLTETKPYGVGIGLFGMNEIEKFAELLVRECHQVIVVGGVDDLDEVLKHFGVE